MGDHPMLIVACIGLLAAVACSIGFIVVSFRHQAEREPRPWWGFTPYVRRAIPWWTATWISLAATALAATAWLLS